MLKNVFKPKIKTILAIIWFIFTFSLVAWWWTFFILRLNPTEPTSVEQLTKSNHMFAWEGSILLASILFGGFALVIFSYRDQRRHERLRFFFATFSHDIKTSIARLRLQAEVLEEELPETSNPILNRLIDDIHRLDLQLENSLMLASLENGSFLQEEIIISDLLSSLRNEFSELSLELERDAIIHGDRRAILSVFRNLLQNSVLHGKATSVQLKVRTHGQNKIQLSITDNGLGFNGPQKKVGSEILTSQNPRSNGIGLLITRKLIQKMNGNVEFGSKANEGFETCIEIKGYMK